MTELEQIREDDPLWFEAMYQGNPSLEAGGILSPPYHHWTDGGAFYRLEFETGAMTIPKSACERYAVIDLAASV